MKNLFDFLKNLDHQSNSLMAKLVFMIKENSLNHFVDIEDFINAVPESLVLVSNTTNFLKHIFRSSNGKELDGKKTIVLPLKLRNENGSFVFKLVCDENTVYMLEFETPNRTLILNTKNNSAIYEMRGRKNFCYSLSKYLGMDESSDDTNNAKSVYFKLMTGSDRENIFNLASAMYGEDLDREAQYSQLNELI